MSVRGGGGGEFAFFENSVGPKYLEQWELTQCSVQKGVRKRASQEQRPTEAGTDTRKALNAN